jgi:predicted transposase/invertase (TIGR01784 family)
MALPFEIPLLYGIFNNFPQEAIMPKNIAVHKNRPVPLGRYAKLTEDMIFKKVFSSEEDKELLIALLNIFFEKKLGCPIIDVDIKNPYIPGETKLGRDAVLDIRCVDKNDNKFIVEMQVNPQKYFIKRAIFYLSMSVAKAGKKTKNWDFDFPNTYSLNFLDFEPDFAKECNDMVQYISLRNDEHPEIKYDYIRFAFVILPRFKKTLDECKSLQEQLIFSLCHAHEYKRKPRQLKGKFFERLFSLAEISNFSDMEHSEYTARMMARYDRYAQLKYAKEEGIIETAKNMLKDGLGVARVARITKLPEKEILALR